MDRRSNRLSRSSVHLPASFDTRKFPEHKQQLAFPRAIRDRRGEIPASKDTAVEALTSKPSHEPSRHDTSSKWDAEVGCLSAQRKRTNCNLDSALEGVQLKVTRDGEVFLMNLYWRRYDQR